MAKKTKRSGSGGTRAAYEKLKEAYKELKDANAEMIFRLAMMAEYHDETTGIHLVRVADYSAIIAEGLGLPGSEVEIIRDASPMHDVGKIMLPDSILKKKGKLTAKERALMKEHPFIGTEIFRGAKTPMLKACSVIAMSHHERFDGTGYPQGLKGDEIPLYGRIVALADCFDALTSRRPYKKAYSFEKSFSMLVEKAGTHFDPAVVMSFVRNKEKIKKIFEANRDIEAFLKDRGISYG